MKCNMEGVDIGKQIRDIRLEKKIGLRELSRRIGISPQTLLGIEKGYHMPEWTTLNKILEALDVRIKISIIK